MKEIRMVDLLSQYEKIQTEIGKALSGVIQSSQFIHGPEVRAFQEELAEFMGCRHVITCANGTDALQLACMALNLKPGDEVITTDFSFVSTLEIIALLGLKPVLVDIRPDTFNIDPDEIEKHITPKTKAIIPVHLYGQCADMERIMQIAAKYGLYVIEDTAQAIGAEYRFPDGTVKKAGTIGTIGTTSFFPSKNLGCYGDGGAIFTNDDALADELRSLANHGQKEQYHYQRVGVNSRLDAIQAAILRVKLRYLQDYTQARREAAAFYDKAFQQWEALSIPARATNSTHVFHQYTITLHGINREELRKALAAKKIPTMVYYPKPLHAHSAYKYLNYADKEFPIAVDMSNRVLSLPMHSELDATQLEYITSAVKEFIQQQ
ncbi:MAG: cell surface polysaccharide biosynthesis protein [Chitinophagales bacterium]|nr:MAG: cell surface polysaccharide biosynthesis protein [Chitinophagales bacterium]